MMGIANVPRPGRVYLPHREIAIRVLRVIEAGIVEGWRQLCANPPGGLTVATALEKDLNAALYDTIVNRVLYPGIVPGFDYSLFRVTRDQKVSSYNGDLIEKMPDMFFHLIDDRRISFPSQDGLFAECKPVDSSHSVGGAYLDEGLSRFSRGEYAWAMREAMMVGYAVAGYSFPTEFASAYTLSRRMADMPYTTGPTACLRSPGTSCSHPVYSTTHARNFVYPSTNSAAGPIVIRHLWLNR